MRRLLALFGALGLLGCPGTPPAIPGAEDAGEATFQDAGEDSGSADAGEDAGPDAGAPDAGLRCSGKSLGAGDFARSLASGGRTREYLLHVPPQYHPTRPAALIVAVHGLMMSAEMMRQLTHFDEVSDEKGFLVAYPEGIGASFNAGACCGTAKTSGVDDVGFLRDLLDLLAADFCLDPARIHVTGFSNGGFMTHRAGCELADRLASIGPVAGEMGISPCTPGRPLPVVMAHGTADPVVPYGGNAVLGYPSTMSTMAGWAERNGCSTTPTRRWSDGGNTADSWEGCDGGSEVTLYSLGGALHEWGGGGIAWDAGAPFNTTRVLVEFFARHPRR